MTAPFGYNASLDASIADGSLGFSRQMFMKRVKINRWRQCELRELNGCHYGKPYPNANGLIVCTFEK
jgi:hypothetical protein